jgi:hypothetical protein
MLAESSETASIQFAHDLSLPRFLGYRVERVRLGPADYWRVDSVRKCFPCVDDSFGHVRIDPQV